jgi:hypothetical protein
LLITKIGGFAKDLLITMVCIIRGHVIIDEEIKRALINDMLVACDRCGIHSPITIDDDNHVRIQPTGDPEIFISGSDLGHMDEWK